MGRVEPLAGATMLPPFCRPPTHRDPIQPVATVSYQMLEPNRLIVS